MHSRSFLNWPYSIAEQNGQSIYPISDENGAKTLPDGAALPIQLI